MAKATVFNPTTKERKAIEVGDPNAFTGGFILETPTNNLSTYKFPGAPSSASPPSPTTPTPIKPAAPATETYKIQWGDTLSQLAQKNNTSVQELMKLNPQITNPNLIYAGKDLTLPGKQTAAGQDFSNVTTVAQANEAINANQDKDISANKSVDEPPVRQTYEDLVAGLKETVAPAQTKPEKVDFTKSLETYRTEYGVTDLETQLNDLKAQEGELLAQKAARVRAEKGKPVAMNVISGRVSEVEAQENERLAVIQRSISNATNQLNTKYNIINSLMKTKELDYNTAVDEYDKELANNIAMFNAAKNMKEEDKSETERMTDNARANAQIALNAMAARGTTYDDLTDAEKTNLTKLGVESGLGADFFSGVLKVSTGKDILTTVVSYDDTQATIIYKDGTTKNIKTGLPAKKSITGTGGAKKLTATELKAQQEEADREAIKNDIKAITGEDGKVDPTKMRQIKNNIAINLPDQLTWFNNAFPPKEMLNPANKGNKAIMLDNKW